MTRYRSAELRAGPQQEEGETEMEIRRIGIVLASLALALVAPVVVADRVIVTNRDITARVPGTDFPDNAWWVSLPKFDAPQVPEDAAEYDISDLVPCPAGYKPEVVWVRAHTAWPNYSVMYTVLAVVEDEKVLLSIRSRQGYDRGYAYLDVKLQCLQDN
ncbi:MAG: hypothetical protein OXP69_17495 [Spirochaetaceae bacterium]|nr:hypothetical protein [Spirochaetaceae bacterium]MDE0336210.1 hypothetical protein [Caldilineaceae bacterium]